MMHPIETVQPKKPENTWQNFWPIFRFVSKFAWLVALSYTLSFEVVAVGGLTKALIESDDNNGNSSNVHAAASTLIMTFMNAATDVCLAPLFGISIVVSKLLGRLEKATTKKARKNLRRRISASIRNSLIIALTLSLLSMSLLFNSGYILTLLGQGTEVAAIAQEFLRPYTMAMLALFPRIALEQIIFSFQHVTATMIMGISSFSIGTVLAICLGYGKFGLPKMGVTGVAIGYIAEAYILAIAYAIYITVQKDLKRFKFLNFYRLGTRYYNQIRELLQVGWPISISFINEVSVGLILSVLAGIIGEDELAALNTSMQFFYFMLLLSAAFGQVSCQELSRSIGKKDYTYASQLAKYSLTSIAVWTASLCAATVVSFNMLDDYLNPMEKNLLSVFALPIFFDVLRYNILQQQRALSDNICSTGISAAGLWLGLLVAGILTLNTDMEVTSLGWSHLGGVLLAFVPLLVRWWSFIQPESMQQRLEETPKKQSSTTTSCIPCLPRFFNKKIPLREQEKLITQTSTIIVN